MAYAQGTASNFNDLLARLITFLTTSPELSAAGQLYEVVYDQTRPYPGQEASGLDRRHVVFRSRGLSGLDEIYTAISTRANTALDYYNWRIQAGVGFFPDNLPASFVDLSQGAGLVNPCPTPQVAMFWNQEIPYHFFANGRRWWVVAKVSTQNESCGAGFILPTCLPTQYRYPMAVWSSINTEGQRWSLVTDLHCGISTGLTSVRTPTGEWRNFHGYQRQLSVSDDSNNGQYLVLPTGGYYPGIPSANTAGGDIDTLRRMRNNPDGGFTLIPVSLAACRNIEYNSTIQKRFGGTFGEADGLFFVPTFNNGPEDTIVRDGVTYIVFQTAQRAGAPYLFALRVN